MLSYTTKIYLVTNQKGGVGKTTLSILIAWYIGKARRYKALLIDGDISQANAIQWSLDLSDEELSEIESGKIYKAKIGRFNVVWVVSPDEIPDVDGYDFVIVDGRPSDIVNSALVPYAHRIIIPFMKRKKDLITTRSWLKDLDKQGYLNKVVLFYNKYCEEISQGKKVPKWFLDYLSEKATALMRIDDKVYDMSKVEKLERIRI